jgi:hypothetical protein
MSNAQRIEHLAHLSVDDEAERIDQQLRRNAKEKVRQLRMHTVAPHNMDGKNDKRTLLDDDPETMETGVRGRATYLLIETMLKGPTTREEILEELRNEFPDKDDKTLKNTLGSLMHSIPLKRGWIVVKTKDKADKRKVIFTITDKGMDSDEARAARAERVRAHSLEGAHQHR